MTGARPIVVVALAGGLVAGAVSAAAQVATIRVSTDSQTGMALPGETIRITTVVSWESDIGAFLAGVRGGTIAIPPPGAGTGTAGGTITSDFTNGGLVQTGTPAGGSLVGTDIAGVPQFFQGGFIVPPWGNNRGIMIHSFDWTAPLEVGAPGVHRFEFVCPPIAPNVRLYASTTTPAFVEATTVFVGASITVIPAPASLVPGLAWAGAACRRARRMC